MELTRNTIDLVKRWGAPAKFAAKLLLGAVLPGSPEVVALLGHVLDCAHETVKDQPNHPVATGTVKDQPDQPALTGKDIQGIQRVLNILDSDLNQLTSHVEEHNESEAVAKQAVEQSLAHLRQDQLAALHKLDSLVQGFDRLKMQNEKLLKEQGFMGSMMETMLPLVGRLGGIADFVDELKTRQVEFQDFVPALRLFQTGVSYLVQGQIDAANRSFEILAKKQPASSTTAVAWAAARAMNCDLDLAQDQLARAARLKGDENKELLSLSTNVERLLRQHTWKLKDHLDATDSTIRGLRALRNLKTLSLQGCINITDKGLVHFSGFRHLKILSLRGCNQVTDSGLAHLRDLASLKELNLMGTKVTHKGLAYLSAFRNLKELQLNGCEGITDEAVQMLRAFPQLTDVYLLGTSVTVQGRHLLNGINVH